MNANLAAVLYLVAGVLFILSLRGLSSPASSRQGNFLGMIGMAIAVATTLAARPPADGIGWVLVILGVAMVGSGGAWARGFGFVALIFASVNIFGGFLVTQRMLAMFQRKQK
jgi:NAD/NADP transhydrogenase beta subunit